MTSWCRSVIGAASCNWCVAIFGIPEWKAKKYSISIRKINTSSDFSRPSLIFQLRICYRRSPHFCQTLQEIPIRQYGNGWIQSSDEFASRSFLSVRKGALGYSWPFLVCVMPCHDTGDNLCMFCAACLNKKHVDDCTKFQEYLQSSARIDPTSLAWFLGEFHVTHYWHVRCK